MKVNVGLTTMLAWALLSASGAMARHHGHHSHSVKAEPVHAARHTSSNAARTGDQGSTLAPADHINATKDASPKSSSSDVRGDDDRSVHDRKAATGDVTVDTRISVRQGHDKPKGVRERLFGKPKSGLAVFAGRSLQPNKQSKTMRHRNAIGTAITDEQQSKQDRPAIGSAAPWATVERPTADLPLSTAGKIEFDNKTSTIGAVQPLVANPSAPTAGGHSAADAAIAVVTKGGQSINGTGFNRPKLNTSGLGGPPRIVAGIISGNSVHLKRP